MSDVTRISNVRPNKTKIKLEQGMTCYGIAIRFPSDQVIDIAASTGCDFVIFDIEHELFSMSELASMIRVADLAGITPIARVGRWYSHLVDPLLSAGIQGFSMARVESAEDITALADMIYYYPQGRRTSYPIGKAANFGIDIDQEAWRAECNRHLLIHAIIEEKAAIDNLDEILAHPHLNVIECGPSDLRLSLGNASAEFVSRLEEELFAKTYAAGKFILEIVPGHLITSRVWKEVRAGHGTMIVGSASGILTAAMQQMVSQVEEKNTGDRKKQD